MSRYIVLDLEMCKVSKAQRRGIFQSARELIQIGAVELDENYHVARTFMSYVKPEFGEMDSSIERLTGITRCDVENAPFCI